MRFFFLVFSLRGRVDVPFSTHLFCCLSVNFSYTLAFKQHKKDCWENWNPELCFWLRMHNITLGSALYFVLLWRTSAAYIASQQAE